MSEFDEQRRNAVNVVVEALLARMPKKRGRPPLGNRGSIDEVRAVLVLQAFIDFPGQFKTRREAIRFLQSMQEWSKAKARPLISFPDRNLEELEQSVSRGVKSLEKRRPGFEKLVKNSVLLFRR